MGTEAVQLSVRAANSTAIIIGIRRAAADKPMHRHSSLESAAALRSMAETAAAEGLPLELERLGSGGQRELAGRYETSPDELVGVLTERHVDGLLNPLGTATSKLQVTTPASEGRIIADLYWRCCIAMQMSAFCKSNRARLHPGCSRCVRRYARLWATRCAH